MTTNQLTVLGTYETNTFDEGGATITAFDSDTNRLFVVNNASNVIDILDLSNPTNPNKIGELDISNFGSSPTGVAVNNGIVAVSVRSESDIEPGQAVFFDTEGNVLNAVEVGVLPDSIAFTPDGTKVITANEGELSEEGDAEGTISVIDISNGVENLTLSTADFTAFNGKEEELRGRGVRILAGKTASEDLEPEAIAVSPDSQTAFITLQENNTVAVVDLNTATVTELQPLGLKDWSQGLPEVTQYRWNLSEEVLGTTPAGQEILLGGMSGLFFEKQEGDTLHFIATPDRGPNGEPTDVDGDGSPERPFPLPDYQPRLVRFSLDQSTGEINLNEQIFLTREVDGEQVPLTGLPNVQAGERGTAYTDEEPVDLLGNPLENDPFGADMESIVVAPDGTFWMSDEYRPAIYHFDKNGELIDRFIPEGTAEAAGVEEGTFGTESLPSVYAQRRTNRGFEGMALDTDKGKLYAWIQSPIDNPDVGNDANSRSSQVLRILEFDPTSGESTGEYIYFLEGSAGVDKIGDAVYKGDGKFLVVERDDGTDATAEKFVYEVNLTGATNILGTELSEATDENALEGKTADDLVELGVQAVTKTKVLNLPSLGYIAGDKVEGLALLPNGSLAVINDNDFGLLPEQIPVDGSVPFNPSPTQTVLGIVDFAGFNQLDASDEDREINLQNWPTLGIYQPDEIKAFEVDDQTYYITANEGDEREENVRVSDVILDPVAFPNAAELQQDENLGRLSISGIDGDIDGDGDFDQLISFGGRSFTIFDSKGNIVSDTGGEFEQITAEQFPEFFNSDNIENNFDNRSDNRGPEPEGNAIGEVNGRLYSFTGLERIGGIMVYDITDPKTPEFVQYINNRDFSGDPEAGTAGDLGPEGLTFISAEDSPTGRPLLVVGNEVSGSTTVYDFGSDAIMGSSGNETLLGTDNNDLIFGEAGDDLVAGLLGDDIINGGEGNDILRGDLNRRSTGGNIGGNDTINGGLGDDRIGGKAGNDALFGDEGDDEIFGDDGDDLLRGGLGNDTLTGDDFSGGQGADTFVLAIGEGTDTITDFEVGIDVISLTEGLSFEQLSLETQGRNTLINFGDETLAILQKVDVASLTYADFSLV
jgi:Ca2+-binding RTX toxin-like protein